ncbi:hypothetical protein QJR26_05610 [Clostridium baratii]
MKNYTCEFSQLITKEDVNLSVTYYVDNNFIRKNYYELQKKFLILISFLLFIISLLILNKLIKYNYLPSYYIFTFILTILSLFIIKNLRNIYIFIFSKLDNKIFNVDNVTHINVFDDFILFTNNNRKLYFHDIKEVTFLENIVLIVTYQKIDYILKVPATDETTNLINFLKSIK